MNKAKKTIEVTVARSIPAPAAEVFAGWLNPKIPGNPWNMAEKLLLDPKVDGFFYWLVHGIPHYGRFTEVKAPRRLQHTWMSPNTGGLETNVTVTFKKQGKGTLMTLVHSGLPDTSGGRSHSKGWNYFLDLFLGQFTAASGKKE